MVTRTSYLQVSIVLCISNKRAYLIMRKNPIINNTYPEGTKCGDTLWSNFSKYLLSLSTVWNSLNLKWDHMVPCVANIWGNDS